MNKDEISIIYKVNDKKLRLFSNDFVKNNKNICKMIIDGKEQKLKEFYNFSIFSAKRDTLEVKLKNITKITNMSNIFSECSAFSSLPDISKLNTTTVTNISGIFRHYHFYLIYLNGILLMFSILKKYFQIVLH